MPSFGTSRLCVGEVVVSVVGRIVRGGEDPGGNTDIVFGKEAGRMYKLYGGLYRDRVLPLTSPFDATISAVPAFTAVTVPSESTVATSGFFELQVRVLSMASSG